jgi:hypothetical protein
MWLTESAIFLFGSAAFEPLRHSMAQLDPSTLTGRSEDYGLVFNFVMFGTVSFFYWKGQNWARWVAMLLCCLCLLELFNLDHEHTLGKVFSTLYDTGLAIFLLWFVNTPPIRRWFLRRTTSVPPPPRL